ncbi:MAG: DNA-binding response regulator, partial [Phycisphaerae bacterium]|nr:DNA-binding response regulator [Phycisphaerae bacterium]
MARGRVAIIEDDASIRAGLAAALRSAGYASVEAGDVASGIRAALADGVDLVLLDLMLPASAAAVATADGPADGLGALREIRRTRPTLPVICVTARGEPEERVAGLDLGADDYIVKPFGVAELLARVNAVLRRSAERSAPTERFRVAGRSIDLGLREARTPSGAINAIPQRESELLAYLASAAGRAVSREELFQRVWGVEGRGGSMRAVDMAVARLRELLEDDASAPEVIRTVRGKG